MFLNDCCVNTGVSPEILEVSFIDIGIDIMLPYC